MTIRASDTRRTGSALLVAWIAGCMLMLAGCGGGGSGTEPAPPPPPPPGPTPPAGGLDARPANASCLAWDRPTGADSISFVNAFPGLPAFSSPVAMLQTPGDGSRWFVVEQAGRVRVFDNVPGANAATDFIDITARVTDGGETGLLGMAFHPGYPTDPRVFLSYTATVSGALISRISAFTSADGGLTLNPASEQVLMTVNQPESNHNGGHIAFGPDGHLYIGLGDGGSGGDPHGPIGNGQRLTTLLGKMLRIDVDAGSPYAIPPDNPFAGGALCPADGRATQNCPEIYAHGFRNPWRWGFDRATGELWLGDVGQNAWEEIDQVERGGNYGWRVREGAHCFNPSANCPTAGLIDPVAEYGRTQGASVTGGYVYRGPQATVLHGRYLFGDFVSGRIWAWIPENAAQPRQPTLLAENTNLSISSFGEGADGELYVVNYAGTLHRIVFQLAGTGGTVPDTLSATGCMLPTDATQPASGLIPYTVNAPFWSDGADKQRWLALPDGQNIAVGGDGDWTFPNGSVLAKHFRIGGQLVETRLLMRHPDGVWAGYTYEWNGSLTDATRVQGGAVRTLAGGGSWIFPSESQCLECHTSATGRVLGLETAQLNGSFTYPQTGRTANQLTTLSAINLLSPPYGSDVSALPALVDPADTAATPEQRARAYLHANCSNCHRPGGGAPGGMDLRYSTALTTTNACNVAPSSGDLGIAGALLIAPGDAAQSVVVARMNRRDAHGMPPLASHTVDAAGVALLTEWVEGLAGC